jgi:hypothetical protein
MDTNKDIDKFLNFLKSNETYANQFIKNMLESNYSNEEYWSEILSKMLLNDIQCKKFILDNFYLFNVKYLIRYGYSLNDEIIDKLIENDIFESDNLYELLTLQHLNAKQINLYVETSTNIKWELLQEYQNLTPEFIYKYIDFINWDLISENQFMELPFLIKNSKLLNWELVGKNYKMQYVMNESFLKLFANTNIWNSVGYIDNINLDTILIQYSDKLNTKSYKSILENRELTDELKEEIMKKIN